LDEQLVRKDWASNPRWKGVHRPYTPSDVVRLRGSTQVEEASAAYAKAIELDPKMAAAHLNLGLVLLERDPAAAVPPLEKAAELLPSQARPRLFLGAALGSCVGIVLIRLRRQRRTEPLPFGPFLAVGALLTIMWQDTILTWYVYHMPY